MIILFYHFCYQNYSLFFFFFFFFFFFLLLLLLLLCFFPYGAFEYIYIDIFAL